MYNIARNWFHMDTIADAYFAYITFISKKKNIMLLHIHDTYKIKMFKR